MNNIIFPFNPPYILPQNQKWMETIKELEEKIDNIEKRIEKLEEQKEKTYLKKDDNYYMI